MPLFIDKELKLTAVKIPIQKVSVRNDYCWKKIFRPELRCTGVSQVKFAARTCPSAARKLEAVTGVLEGVTCDSFCGPRIGPRQDRRS
ncbi:hypothetical protein HAX54_040441, partial [Datura stramonium]|nr:hypothetical protein [Datura stramonium]